MRISFSDDPRDFLRRDWSEVVDADPGATFFHAPRYLKLYWEELGQDVELLLAFAEEDGRTVGAVAFERLGRTLRFLGGTEVTDYMGPVAVPGTEDRVAKELIDAVAGLDWWTDADLRGLPEDSPWLSRLQDAAAGEGLSSQVAEDSVAPCLHLPPTYEEYLAGLPSKLRHEIRRKARRLDGEVGRHALVLATTETLEDDLGRFVALHRSSEGPKGKFMVPGMEIFFRRLGETFLPEGIFRLAFLEAGGERMAGAIAFTFRETTYLYNSAFDRGHRGLAPGMVLVADLIDRAIADGCRRFDLLKGDLAYKYRFGARPRPVKRLVLGR
ncbi:MAG: GNAT family N-acetyltransferase [Actinomycetota bacterium]|nr:GNAT family N-acetyltransferase [Actinomycetota bacterium]